MKRDLNRLFEKGRKVKRLAQNLQYITCTVRCIAPGLSLSNGTESSLYVPGENILPVDLSSWEDPMQPASFWAATAT
jgi:hypothetical protein